MENEALVIIHLVVLINVDAPKRGKRSEQGGKLKHLMLLNDQVKGWLK